jgi:hypothetical protein
MIGGIRHSDDAVMRVPSQRQLTGFAGLLGCCRIQKGSTKVTFRLSSLRREKSGAFKARKGIPADIRAEYQSLYGKPQARSKVAWEAIFYASAGTPVQKVKTAHAEWLALIEGRVDILRQQKLGAARTSHRSGRGSGWRVVPVVRQPT